MSARIRLLIACTMLMSWACSASGPEATIMPGDACRESEVDDTKCGKALLKDQVGSLFGSQRGAEQETLSYEAGPEEGCFSFNGATMCYKAAARCG